MKKKILIVMLALVLLIVSSYFIEKWTKEKGMISNYQELNNGVSLKVKDGTLTNNSAKVILRNDSDYLVSYGEPYHLEVLKDGVWKKLEPKNDLLFILPAYYLSKNREVELDIYWSGYYGELDSGNYRIVKSVSFEYSDDKRDDFMVAAPFVIE